MQLLYVTLNFKKEYEVEKLKYVISIYLSGTNKGTNPFWRITRNIPRYIKPQLDIIVNINLLIKTPTPLKFLLNNLTLLINYYHEWINSFIHRNIYRYGSIFLRSRSCRLCYLTDNRYYTPNAIKRQVYRAKTSKLNFKLISISFCLIDG